MPTLTNWLGTYLYRPQPTNPTIAEVGAVDAVKGGASPVKEEGAEETLN